MAIDHTGDSEAVRLAASARLVGTIGLIPFLILSVWLYAIAPDHLWRAGTVTLLKAYAAIALSFFGGIRWGLAMTHPSDERRRDLTLSAAPPLLGWVGFMAAAPYAFAFFAAAFAAQGAWDTLATHSGTAPGWYGRLRTLLTAAIVATMILAFLATG